MLDGNDNIPNDHFCDSYTGDRQSKDPRNYGSNFSSALPTLLLTDRRKDGTGIQRYYLDPPITEVSLGDFVKKFIHDRSEPEEKSGRTSVDNAQGAHKGGKVSTSKHFINLLTAESLPNFLEVNRENHVLVELYAPTCGHCKRFNIIWNSLGQLIEFLGWSDWLVLARVDVTSNEIFIPGMEAKWLPDLFYFGVGIDENPIHYGQTSLADEKELGSINDPLELLEWWMDEAGDTINEVELLQALEETSYKA